MVVGCQLWSKLDEPRYVTVGGAVRAWCAEMTMWNCCDGGMGADSPGRSGVEGALGSQHGNGNICVVSVGV